MTLKKISIVPALVFMAMVWVACAPASKKSEEEEASSGDPDSHPIKMTEPIALAEGTAWTEFEMVYSHQEGETTQKLGVKYLPDNKLEFRLQEKNNLCDVDYSGTAENLYPGGDGETDEDA